VAAIDSAHFKEVLGHYITGIVIVTAMTPEGPADSPARRSARSRSTRLSYSSPQSLPLRRGSGYVRRGWWASTFWPTTRSTWLALRRQRGRQICRVPWVGAPNGSPFLDGAHAHLEGTIREVTSHGDHDIIVAELDYASTEPGEPLAYYRGGIGCSGRREFTTLRDVTRASEANRAEDPM